MTRIQYVHCDAPSEGVISAKVWCEARYLMRLRDFLDVSVMCETIAYSEQKETCKNSRQCSISNIIPTFVYKTGIRNAYTIFVGTAEGKRPLGSFQQRGVPRLRQGVSVSQQLKTWSAMSPSEQTNLKESYFVISPRAVYHQSVPHGATPLEAYDHTSLFF